MDMVDCRGRFYAFMLTNVDPMPKKASKERHEKAMSLMVLCLLCDGLPLCTEQIW